MKIMINNKTTVVWAVIAAVLFMGVWYLFAKNAGTYTEVIEETATTTPAVEKPVVKAPVKKAPAPVVTSAAPAPTNLMGVEPMKQLIARKEALKCAVDSMSGPKRTGVLYISKEGKARADFAASSMINDGEYLYAWETGASTGIKLLATLSASGSAIAAAGGVDPTTNLRFACNPWTVDESVFTPPASITF